MADEMGSVTAALDMAAEELDQLVAGLRKQGAAAYEQGDRARFDALNTQIQAVETFANAFRSLHGQWKELRKSTPRRKRTPGKSQTTRAKRGELLPEREYVFPILRTLRKNGGSAAKDDVLAALQSIIGSKLKPRDKEPMGSGEIRWHNRAAWVRNNLAAAGFISRESRRGVWEITEDGLAELKRGDLDATWSEIMDAKKTPEELEARDHVKRLLAQFGGGDA